MGFEHAMSIHHACSHFALGDSPLLCACLVAVCKWSLGLVQSEILTRQLKRATEILKIDMNQNLSN